MSTSSADSSPPVSGLDYDDTALTLALPGSSSSAADPAAAERKRAGAAHVDHDKPPSPKYDAKLVKVAVDGAPYLRKVDLAAHGGYAALLRALHGMFASCLAVRGDGEGTKLVDSVTGAEYVPTYEDKDGDWMLVGDVPWKMFVEACKRIRLMKSSEAVNLSPRRSSR
ncbi:hypothetical protein E2562_027893 [Oryza meyeriana var. granulata]|uniref:Auxin-responsive protein n=1 Tax=Oryza meyeriana var. granulata TaxID=110450 RepID=A0A6G1CS81_9ORYZ|nr:hypothetical protein E2562_027893 [Oryza meyeriana var. granulata]